jgi:phosphoglycerate dehydrogenase-like enzyme
MLLRHARRLPEFEANQREHAWQRVECDELTGKTLVVVGVGGIGREVARLASAFGMRVLGVRRSPGPEPHVEALYPPERLAEVLPQADYLVLACPLTRETRGLINAERLALLTPDAYLVNIARGGVVVEAALIEALRAGRLAGAALDVFEQEPLPPESPLWSLPNVIVTPHNSAASPRTLDRGAAIFLDNLRRFAANEPLRGVAEFSDET